MVWRAGILGVAVAAVSGCGFGQVVCTARTPLQVLPSGWIGTAHESASSSGSFYRLARIIIDPELHRRWALVANCTHPERPLEIVALSTGHMIIPTRTVQPVRSALPVTKVVGRRIQTKAARDSATFSPLIAPQPRAPMVAETSAPNPSATVDTSTPVDSSAMVPMIHAGDLVRLWRLDGNVRLEMAAVSLEYGRVGQIIHLRRVGQTALLAGVVMGKDSAELIP
jgi:hypothetical protein